jgi:hydrogenase maturation protease
VLTIIGCGNLNRCDDGIGVIVVRELERWLQRELVPFPENIQIFDCGTGGMEVMFRARGSRRLILIDASSTGSQAGAVYRVPGEELAQLPEPSYNLHDFRWDHAIAAGRKIYRQDFPEDVTVFLIEAENLGFGLEISATVRSAGDRVLGELREICQNWRES